LSAFAAFAADIDLIRAKRSCVQAAHGAVWLESSGRSFPDPGAKAVVYAQLAICIQQLGLDDDREIRSVLPPLFGTTASVKALNRAIDAADADIKQWSQVVEDSTHSPLCTNFSQFPQFTLRTIPFFEGVYLLKTRFASHIPSLGDWDSTLARIKSDLVQNIAFRRGFQIVPQADARSSLCWLDATDLPQPIATTDLPGVFWYVNLQVETSAIDMLFLAKMTGPEEGLERIASGSLGWITGLGPGVPAYKAINPRCQSSSFNNDAWQSAAFIRNLDARFAQGYIHLFDPNNPESGKAKSWFSCWEKSADSRSREVWWVDPLNNGFMTMVNGYTIENGGWAYHNEGFQGWYSGETFILEDGLFVKAAMLYEDYLSPSSLILTRPVFIRTP
jgi:hypothetical protein